MAIAQVQKAKGTVSGASSVSAVLSAAPTAGNLLVAYHRWGGAGTDNTPPTGWTVAIESSRTTGTTTAIYYRIAQSGDSATVTATTGGLSDQILIVLEYSGMAASAVLDVTAAANAGAAVSAVAGPTATTAQADELAIAGISMSGAHGGIISVSDSFTLEDDGLTGGVASKILAATGTPQTTFSWTTSRGWATAIATFKAAAAGAAQTISPTGVASAEALGSPTLTVGVVSVSPTAIASGELVGTAAVSPGPVTITTVGVASAEAFGTVFLGAASQAIGATGVASSQGFGAPTVLAEAASTARVQAPTPAGSTGTTSISLAWNQATGAGNFLVAALAVRAIAGDSIVTPPSGWLHSGRVEAGTNVHLDVFTIENAASRSGTETFTVPTARDMTLHLVEYSGIEATNASDQGTVENGNTATPSTGTTGVTGQAKELWLGFIAHRNKTSVQSSPTNSFVFASYAESANTDATQAVASGVYDRIVTATGTAGTSVTLGTTRPYAGRVATFKSAGLPAQTVSPAGIASAQGFGAPTLSGAVATLTIAPASFYEHEFGGSFGDFGGGVGSPTLSAVDAVNLVGIPTGEAFGAPALSLETSAIITTVGIPGEEAFGVAGVTGGGDTIGYSGMGIVSEEAFGEPILAYVIVGIPSTEAFGVPEVLPDAQSFEVEGIPSDADNGIPTITTGDFTFSVTGVPSGEEFGGTLVSSQQAIRTASIQSAQAFGQLDVQRIRVFSPPTVEGNRNDMNYRPRVLMDRFWLRVPGVARGITIWRTNGIWHEGSPTITDLNAAELIYLGGHEYIVSEQAASELEAEGYVVA